MRRRRSPQTEHRYQRRQPTPKRAGPVCANNLRIGGAANGAATVDADPTELISTWLPGLNPRACQAVTVASTRDVAVEVANEIRTAPKSYPGIRSCLSDDGSPVELVFSYSSPPEVVYVRLTGCAVIIAPGRSSRDMTGALRKELNMIAPPE